MFGASNVHHEVLERATLRGRRLRRDAAAGRVDPAGGGDRSGPPLARGLRGSWDLRQLPSPVAFHSYATSAELTERRSSSTEEAALPWRAAERANHGRLGPARAAQTAGASGFATNPERISRSSTAVPSGPSTSRVTDTVIAWATSWTSAGNASSWTPASGPAPGISYSEITTGGRVSRTPFRSTEKSSRPSRRRGRADSVLGCAGSPGNARRRSDFAGLARLRVRSASCPHRRKPRRRSGASRMARLHLLARPWPGGGAALCCCGRAPGRRGRG